MSTFLMSELYEMSRKRAQFLIDLFFALFPKVKQWQQSTIKDAHMHTRLVNPWGYRMPFWDVYRWNQRRYDKLKQLWIKHQTNQKIPAKTDMRWVQRIELEGGNEAAIARLSFDLGDEAKSAVSFLPRDIGAAMLKDALLTLEEKNQLVSKGVIRCSIHDSILAICKRSDAPEVAEAVRNAMAAPVARLNGLVIEVEQSWGRTWEKSQMEEWK
jgi:DNA polymerase I-like protein with 3'-5' exonuclease and polymerase domains